MKKKPLLNAFVTFPPGFEKDAISEINTIFAKLWLHKNQRPLIELQKNKIRLNNVHIDSLFELLLRSLIINDIRIIIHESLVKNKPSLQSICHKIAWENYLNQYYPIKVKVNSIASTLFHERAMKELICDILKEKSFCLASNGENLVKQTDEENPKPHKKELLNNLFFEIYKNKLTISLSLVGSELYKRNYKKILTASAPLREDIAYLCLKKSLVSPITALFVPFGGTGTFIFEYLILILQLPNNFFNKIFSFENGPIFKEKTFAFLNKKSLQESEQKGLDLKYIFYSDIAENVAEGFSKNYTYFSEIIKEKSPFIYEKIKDIEIKIKHDNFLKINTKNFANLFRKGETVFMPLNPPYGLRLQSKTDNLKFFSSIINKINDFIACFKERELTINVLLLCPSEETWSLAMNKLHTQNKETFHFTQGGVHIRAITLFI